MLKNIPTLLLSLSILVGCEGGGNNINTGTTPDNSATDVTTINKDESGVDKPSTVNLKSITITTTKNEIYIGESAQLTVTANYSDATTKNITNEIEWNSKESNYTYSTTTKGLLYGIHAGTKPVQLSYNNMLSNSIQLTVKPTLFYSIYDGGYSESVYAPYGLIVKNNPVDTKSNNSPVKIDGKISKALFSPHTPDNINAPLLVLNGKLYLSQDSGIIYVLDLTSSTRTLHPLKRLPGDHPYAPLLFNIHDNLVAMSDDNFYYWDANSSNWVAIYIPYPFVEHLNKLYALGAVGYSNEQFDVYSTDIDKQLPLTAENWHKITTATNDDETVNVNIQFAKAQQHIINNRLYNVPLGTSIVAKSLNISSIDITKPSAAWESYSFAELNEYTNDNSTSYNTVIESTIYISFQNFVNQTSKIFSIKTSQESAPAIKDISMPAADNINNTSFMLINADKILYAISMQHGSAIYSYDTSKKKPEWEIYIKEIPNYAGDIYRAYVAY